MISSTFILKSFTGKMFSGIAAALVQFETSLTSKNFTAATFATIQDGLGDSASTVGNEVLQHCFQ